MEPHAVLREDGDGESELALTVQPNETSAGVPDHELARATGRAACAHHMDLARAGAAGDGPGKDLLAAEVHPPVGMDDELSVLREGSGHHAREDTGEVDVPELVTAYGVGVTKGDAGERAGPVARNDLDAGQGQRQGRIRVLRTGRKLSAAGEDAYANPKGSREE